MLGAVMFGHEQQQAVIKEIAEFAKKVNRPVWDWVKPAENTALIEAVKADAEVAVGEAFRIVDKLERQDKLAEIQKATCEKLKASNEEWADKDNEIAKIFFELERNIVRERILSGEKRIDGRTLRMIRPITIAAGILPRVHGSALFTRGETQSIGTCTLGSERDAQTFEDMAGVRSDRFILHYNFPPYCVGEIGLIGSPKRREIGHGRLAKRALKAVLPSMEEFPYSIRVVSEITESNGSSSMASVCSGCLSLLDAGVPVKAPVAGIAMGLVKEEDRVAILTDIMGDEDHLGDMDFKVAGTRDGVTALQMDIKTDGITREIMQNALTDAHAARIHLLNVMAKALPEPRQTLSPYAPRVVTIKVPANKVKEVIGKGGFNVRSIQADTNSQIDIEDDGTVKISASSQASAESAIERINSLLVEVEVGKDYDGKIVRITDFGAFVNILPGRDGLVHISQIAKERVENVADYLTVGDEVRVRVLDIDNTGRIRLSIKALTDEAEAAEAEANQSENAQEAPVEEKTEEAVEAPVEQQAQVNPYENSPRADQQ